MSSKNNKNNRTGFLFMFVIIILLLIIVYAYKDKFALFFNSEFIKFDNFSFFNSKNIFNNKKDRKKDINITETIKLIDKKDNVKKNIKKTDINEDKNLTKSKENIEKKIVEKEKEEEKVIINKKQEKFQINKKEIVNNREESSTKIEKGENKDLRKRISKIYFTMLDNNDNLVLKNVEREITYYNTPLTETLKELFNGPNSYELKSNYITNIPKGSKILKIWIKDKILYLDISKEFENNNYGRESTINQLKQIVFTATEFPNIQKVKFLINGKEENYLGGEGVFIGKPLGRDDF